jgi:hypothetical protein
MSWNHEEYPSLPAIEMFGHKQRRNKKLKGFIMRTGGV